MTSKKYRSSAKNQTVVAFSVSYQRDDLLARGMGLEHLRELLFRLARPIVRHGASLAYGGNWKETDDNFTYYFLRLISAEQEDNSAGGPDTSLQIGILYNHSAWPHYLDISRAIEAQWINACRIVRVTQRDAGIAEGDTMLDIAAKDEASSAKLNAALCLSAMRRMAMDPMFISIPDVPSPEIIPPVSARILLGGKIDSFSGFVPGLFEEALVTLEHERPTYILGGFGGAAGIVADAILDQSGGRPKELTKDWLLARNPQLFKLLDAVTNMTLPSRARVTDALLDALFLYVEKARANPAEVLQTGLDDAETRELLSTRTIATAVNLVRKGLDSIEKFTPLPA